MGRPLGSKNKVMTLAALKQIESDTKSLAQDPVEKDLSKETDEQIMERLGQRFEILEDMTRAVKKGDVRAMIVSGPPGVGKSFGVEKVLSKHDVFADVADDKKLKKYEIVKGAMSAIACTQSSMSSQTRSQSLCLTTVTAYCWTT